MKFLTKIFGDESSRALKKYSKIVDQINAFEPAIKALSDTDLKAKTSEFKAKIASEAAKVADKDQATKDATLAATLDSIMPEAFAVVREAAWRTLRQRHFDVQLIGGMILHNKGIAEMRTGEGKTLVATLPVYLNALSGKGVHVVTVNDYLSRRDAVWMGQIYAFLGLTTSVLNHEASYVYDPEHKAAPAPISTTSSTAATSTAVDDPVDKERDDKGSFKVMHEFLRPCTRREAYGVDITYGTNHEFGFDYLRDNLEYSTESLRQRPFYFAVVDEIDSILIDEARTPLIISAPSSQSEHLYDQFTGIVANFVKDEDYTVEEKKHAISVTQSGIEKAEKALGIGNIYTDKGIKYVHHLETAVKAKALYHKDKQYVVKDNEVVIVDEFTGHIQPGRRWSEGLHQAIESKERVPIQRESRTYASITYQNFFRLYQKLAGMTGTALTSSEEFYRVYGLGVIAVPTNKTIQRVDHNDLILRTRQGKFKAIARRVKELHDKGQPVLVGTVSIENNELLSAFLKAEGIPHEILNAKNHEREGEIIAQAGRRGSVTIATNMAGRGVDIKLGGYPNTKSKIEEVKGLGGLFVLGTERHEARRIDNQLRGRSGRQGDPGETQFFVSLEDDLMRVFASDTLKSVMGRLGVPEDEPIQNSIITKSLETAQTRIEGYHFDSRKHVLEYDDVLNQQRKTIYERRRSALVGDEAKIFTTLDEIITGAWGETGLATPEDLERLRTVIEEKKTKYGKETLSKVVRQIILQSIDMFWVDHLELMDYLRGSVNLRAYGQRDPLVEYKKEGLRLFRDMLSAISMQIIKLIPHIGAQVAEDDAVVLNEVQDAAASITSGAASNGGNAVTSKSKSSDTTANTPKLGRNEPCYCGSGKKFKHCHGK